MQEEHFNLYLSAAIGQLLTSLSRLLGSEESMLRQFPFLESYTGQVHSSQNWLACIDSFENGHGDAHLPMRALAKSASLDKSAMLCLLTAGLIDEDARFGMLFETLQGIPGPGPNAGLLQALVPDQARTNLRDLQLKGLLQVTNPQAPRPHWILQPPPAIWDALRGERPKTPVAGMELTELDSLPGRDSLVIEEEHAKSLAAINGLMQLGDLQTLIIRGPQRNGRRTLLSAVARSLGRAALLSDHVSKSDDERWKLAGPLAALLHAMPIAHVDVAPAESIDLDNWPAYHGPVGIAAGKSGGINGPLADRAYTMTIGVPSEELRRRLWERHFPNAPDFAEAFRISSGNIHRGAVLASHWGAVEGRVEASLSDVRHAVRTLNRQALDALATRVETVGQWGHLAAPPATLRELQTLEGRCRNRERLTASMRPAALETRLNSGVRALFTGPSGSGKTLAAKILASSLEMDLYRVDLSTVVNKYIGETEKNLDRLFSRAEELDVIVLLDEGDALMTQRTGVSNANDRYANLETNFLLQRIESFEGILVVTTNSGDRIDNAFQRRMDVVIEFRPPDAVERWTIWQSHLPAGHRVTEAFIEETAARCNLTGGQIRNAAVHASLLALNAGSSINSEHVEEAVRREYRKSGSVCPLRLRIA